MKNAIAYNYDCDIYPGAYVPVLNDKEVENYIHQPHKNELSFPVVNIADLEDLYKIEVEIPGVNREDFFIHADNNILSLCVIHTDKEHNLSRTHRECNDAEFKCLDRHIVLPENADPEFIVAEYKEGTLCMHAPKTKRPVRHLHSTVVVY